MRRLAERAYFGLCRSMGKLLRASRYSRVRIVSDNNERDVQKKRSFYAPVLISMGGPLLRILDTRIRILRQLDWEQQERARYHALYGSSIRVNADGTLILPYLQGETLATLLEDQTIGSAVRERAIALAVTALVEFHGAGFTHGDAMAENVMIDVDAGTARWFDFETIHEPQRDSAAGRADDVRALLATCLLRTESGEFARVARLIVNGYGDDEVTRLLTVSFSSILSRPLPFHLGQAALSFQDYQTIARVLTLSCQP